MLLVANSGFFWNSAKKQVQPRESVLSLREVAHKYIRENCQVLHVETLILADYLAIASSSNPVPQRLMCWTIATAVNRTLAAVS